MFQSFKEVNFAGKLVGVTIPTIKMKYDGYPLE
jgi:hypothetical protein